MSRSYRKPYHYWCGGGSVKQDRQVAARCFRRLENRTLHKVFLQEISPEDYVHPVQYEASFNDRWSWGCDGSAALYDRPGNYALTRAGLGDPTWVEDAWKRIREIQRK